VSNDDQLKRGRSRFDVLQRAASALCRALPPQQRPPVKLMSLHIWALSTASPISSSRRAGVAKLPLPPEQILESAMLVYLRGLGILPPDSPAAAPSP